MDKLHHECAQPPPPTLLGGGGLSAPLASVRLSKKRRARPAEVGFLESVERWTS